MVVRIEFEDSNGQEGVITESLEVRYAGEWEEMVDEKVNETREDEGVSVEDDDPPIRLIFNRLMTELPIDIPIVELERVADSETYPRS